VHVIWRGTNSKDRVIFTNLTIVKLVRKFPAFYGTRSLITVLT
jgi:hypothetical protein